MRCLTSIEDSGDQGRRLSKLLPPGLHKCPARGSWWRRIAILRLAHDRLVMVLEASRREGLVGKVERVVLAVVKKDKQRVRARKPQEKKEVG